MDINFKVNISVFFLIMVEMNEFVFKDVVLKVLVSMRFGCFKMNVDMNVSYLLKKDFKVIFDFKYSVEYIMDVVVKVG